MVRNALRQYANSIGFSEQNGTVYGTIDGYTVTLAEGSITSALSGSPGGAYNIWVNAYFPRQEHYQDLMARIKENGRTYRVLDQFRYSHGIRINLGGSFTEFLAFVAWLMPVIAECGGQRISKCPLCGQSYGENPNTAYVRLQGMAVPAHVHCIEHTIAHQGEANQEEKNIGRGTLGAVLGGFLGCLPWIISYLFGFFVWVFGLMIGLGASVGYKLAGGKPCRAKYAIILLCVIFFSLFSFFVCTAASVAVDIVVGDSQGSLWGNLAERLQEEQFLSYDLKIGIIGFICALAGCVYLFDEMRQTLSRKKEDIRLP